MRYLGRGLLGTCICAAIFASPGLVLAQNAPTNSLRSGDSKAEVILLQQILNSSSDTIVSASGPGSPGMESSYFGPKTLDAVKRFQAKYSADVLVPAGLTVPTGFVGPLTLKKLRQLSVVAPQAQPSSGNASIPTSTAETASAAAPDSAFFDPKYGMELYASYIKAEQEKLGLSLEAIEASQAQIRASATTSQEAKNRFFKEQQEIYKKKQAVEAAKPLAIRALGVVLEGLTGLFGPETAHAGIGLPFGGYVLWVTPCTCAPVAQIFVFLPRPTPTSNFTLNYIYGSEAFRWYNLPEPTIATVGLYAPAVQSCFMLVPAIPPFCVPFPALGTITPVTGSSLLP